MSDSQERDESLSDVLARWRRRFQRSVAIYEDSFADEEFHDVVAVLVTGAFLEAVLWIGIQIAGHQPKHSTKDLTLKALIRKAHELNVLQEPQTAIATAFADLRNDAAHDIDFAVDADKVCRLFELLPAENQATIDGALKNVWGASHGVTLRLTFEQMMVMVLADLQRCLERGLGRTTE